MSLINGTTGRTLATAAVPMTNDDIMNDEGVLKLVLHWDACRLPVLCVHAASTLPDDFWGQG